MNDNIGKKYYKMEIIAFVLIAAAFLISSILIPIFLHTDLLLSVLFVLFAIPVLSLFLYLLYALAELITRLIAISQDLRMMKKFFCDEDDWNNMLYNIELNTFGINKRIDQLHEVVKMLKTIRFDTMELKEMKLAELSDDENPTEDEA